MFYKIGLFDGLTVITDFILKNYKEDLYTNAIIPVFGHMPALWGLVQPEDYENAITYFEKALLFEECTDEMRKEMMYNKVVAYEKMMDWDSAKIAVDNYLKSYPDDEMAIKESEFLETR